MGSKIVNKRGEGLFLVIMLGIVEAVVVGWLGRLLGYSGVSGVDLYSICVSVLGAIVVLVVYHQIRR